FAADSFAFYGLAGIGANSDTEAYVPVGVGAAVLVTDNLSLKAEYQYQWDIDDGADDDHVGKIGFNFHFGAVALGSPPGKAPLRRGFLLAVLPCGAGRRAPLTGLHSSGFVSLE